MRTDLVIFACSCLLFAVSACGGFIPSSNANPSAPAVTASMPTTIASAEPPPATPTPIDLTRVNPRDAKRPSNSTQDCALLTDGDVAGFFAAEVNQPLHGNGAAQRVIFSPERISTQESYCIYLAFHLSGSASGRTYQLTYWEDKPGQATPEAWAQVWSNAKARAEQTVSGIGEEAFYDQGRLMFKKNNVYITVEVIATKMDTTTQAGKNEQLDIEKRVALQILKRLG